MKIHSVVLVFLHVDRQTGEANKHIFVSFRCKRRKNIGN
jgi:hypothetical protein